MTLEELNAQAEGLVDVVLDLMEKGNDSCSLSFEIKVPGKPRLTVLIGINERAEQLKSFADAIGHKPIPIAEEEGS